MTVEAKARDLLKRMTIEEKVAQLGSAPAWDLVEGGRFSQEKAERLLGKGIGQVTRVAGASGAGPKEAATIVNQIQRFLVEKTRLGIPAVVHEECLSGFMAMGATTFPQAIGMASTWNEGLVQRITSTIREQMRATGASQGLSPVLDVARDPRWGRTEETFGEDPYLVARIGAAYVKGLQGEDPRTGVLATVKHFAAHGFPEGGRNCAPVHVSPREFREVFLFPFEAAVKEAGAGSLMNAYHEIDGVPCASSRHLLTDVLRGEWGFKGFVVSDYGAVKMLQTFHRVAGSEKEAAVMALEAGIDVELPAAQCYGEPLLQAAKEGLVSEATVDEAVSRILEAKFLLGLFDNPYVDAELAPLILDRAEHRALALQAARESIVLLKNEGLLPLDKSIRSIAVVGPNAASTRNLLGDYSYTAHLSCKGDVVPVVSVLEGIRRKLPRAEVHYARGCEVAGSSTEGFEEAVNVARKSEVVVAVVGERSGLSRDDVSGEGRDRTDLGLPGVQEELLRALCKAGRPVVVVLVNGRPLSTRWIAENCPAIVEAWLPGEEGGSAIADVLFGDYNPGGRLPISIPLEVGQIPINYNRKPSSFGNYVFSTSKPLFPFGHGLSYTKFEYGSLKIEPDRVGPAGKVTVGFEVKNAGDRNGDEVVQLYVSDPVASVSRPLKELKGFKRVSLDRGEKKAVEFHLYMEQLAFYDRHMRLVVEPGRYDVMVGASSEDVRLTGSFDVVGEVKVVPSRRVFFSEVFVG
ncbi:MAG: glycoside hydrolase family 3 C-terminal domain-containing protein [Candidatus Brockarchaeota archaeon]|nr:glycoside hydrolase family 3 C-terminal domain-containing protein [Candidatus Brockarchaeota archaeon]